MNNQLSQSILESQSTHDSDRGGNDSDSTVILLAISTTKGHSCPYLYFYTLAHKNS